MLYFSLKMSPSSSSSAKRSTDFLVFSGPAEREGDQHSENSSEASSNNNLPVYPHSPDADFFVLFPPKKSSSSSSSSNSPPPPKPAPEGGCLVGAGVPFSLLPTESESFPEINRLFSDERISSGLMSVMIQTAKYYSISFYITLCCTWKNRNATCRYLLSRLVRFLEEKTNGFKHY